MDEIVIHFSPEGTAHCLWNDDLALHQLGQIHVERASQVEFDNEDQLWYVQFLDGEGIMGFETRAEAIEHEVRVLQLKMKHKK